MNRVVEFLKTTILGGALVVLPVWITVLLLLKAVMQLQIFVKPVASALPSDLVHPRVMAVLVLLIVCFAVGAAVRTAIGSQVRRTVERIIVLEAPQLDLLLYDWLSELIFLKDRDGHVFTQTQATVRGDGPCRLSARVAGGVIDPDATELGADPKAVTFHQFVLERVPDGSWRARVVIDI